MPRGAHKHMNGLTDFIQRVASIAIKLLLVLAAAVFLISLLLAAIVVMLAVSIWALLTGRKPDSASFASRRPASRRVAGPAGRVVADQANPNRSSSTYRPMRCPTNPQPTAKAALAHRAAASR